MEWKIFISESFGTFILSTSVNFMPDYSKNSQMLNLCNLIIGIFIAAMFSKRISGAHFNPAVTLLNYLINKGEKRERVRLLAKEYILGQFTGAFIPPILSNLLLGNSMYLRPAAEAGFIGTFIMETLGSMILYLIITFLNKTENNLFADDDVIGNLTMVLGIAGGVSIAGNESGAGLNPAVSIALNVVKLATTGDFNAIRYTLIYIFAPLTAVRCTIITYNLVSKIEIEI